MTSHQAQRYSSRRELLNRLGGGVAGLAFANLLSRDTARAARLDPMAPRKPHHPAKAKAIISVFCYGGVSHMDTFDPKRCSRSAPVKR